MNSGTPHDSHDADGKSPAEFYAGRMRDLERDLAAVRGRITVRYKLLTLLGFAALAVLWLFFTHRWPPAWTVAIVILPAAYLIMQIGRLRREPLRLMKLQEYYEAGIARLGRDWGALRDGAEFQDPKHLYAADLDLFGRASLFQVLCSARTQAGRETLADWMKHPADREEILARRAAVAELRSRLDLRESIAAAGTGTVYYSDCRPETFRNWVDEHASQRAFPAWLPFAGALLSLSLLLPPLLYWIGTQSLNGMWSYVIALLLAEGVFALPFRKRVRFILDSLGPLSVELPVVCELLGMIETERFSSPKLIDLAARLKTDGTTAATAMRHLDRLIRLLNERDNEWFTYLSYCLLWATQFSAAIERWHRRWGGQILGWLEVLGEFEALISLATYANEHPADVVPELVEEGQVFEATGLGHPLLDEAICVRNDVRLGRSPRFLVISGSNMSGKSTFLRAMGVNAVLARMGAPVRCVRLRLSLLSVGAAIRISDSLAEGRSHFFAEMDRLRLLIELASREPTLFLADEIMIGTNSHDRRIAAEWVVQALVLRHAIGALSTHDLALTEIASGDLPGVNFYFEDSGENGELVFDYKLRPGILSHSNALNIAHILGIDTAATVATPSTAASLPIQDDL